MEDRLKKFIAMALCFLVIFIFSLPPEYNEKFGEKGLSPTTTTTQKLIPTTTTQKVAPIPTTTTTQKLIPTTTTQKLTPIPTTTQRVIPTPSTIRQYDGSDEGAIFEYEKYKIFEDTLKKPSVVIKRIEEDQKKLLSVEKIDDLKEHIKLDFEKKDKLVLCNLKFTGFVKDYKGAQDIDSDLVKGLVDTCSSYFVSEKPYIEVDTDIEKCDLGDLKLKLKYYEIEHIYKRVKFCKEHIAEKLAINCPLQSYIKEERETHGKVKKVLDIDGLEAKCGQFLSMQLTDFEDCGLKELKFKYPDIDFERLYEKVRNCEDKDVKEDWEECDLEYFIKRTPAFISTTGIKPLDNIVFTPEEIDIAIKRCSKKLTRKIWKWEDCDYRNFLKFHINNYKLNKDPKTVIHLKGLIKKCNAHINQKLERYKECKLDDVTNKYPSIDIEHIYNRIKLCKHHLELVKLKEFGELTGLLKTYHDKKGVRLGSRVKFEEDLYADKIVNWEGPDVKINDLKGEIDKQVKLKQAWGTKTIWDIEDCGLGKLKTIYKDIDLDNLYERIDNCNKEYEKKKIEECNIEDEEEVTPPSIQEETFTDVEQCKQHYFKKVWENCDLGWHSGQGKEEKISLYDKVESCKLMVAKNLVSDCGFIKRVTRRVGGRGGGGCKSSKHDGSVCDPTSPNFEGFDYEIPDIEIASSLDNETLLELAITKLPTCPKYKQFNFKNVVQCQFIYEDLKGRIDDFENIFIRGRNCKLKLKESFKECEKKVEQYNKLKLAENKDIKVLQHEIGVKSKFQFKYGLKYKDKDWLRVADKLKKCKRELKFKYEDKCTFKQVKEKSKTVVIKGGRAGGGCHIRNDGGPCDPNSPNFEGFNFEPLIEVEPQKVTITSTDVENIVNNCKEDWKIKFKEKGFCKDVEIDDIDTDNTEQILQDVEKCKEKDNIVKKIADCDFTDIELKYPELDIEETYNKVKQCKEHIATKLWQECSLNNVVGKMKKLFKLKLPLLKDDADIHLKARLYLKAVNIPLMKCQKYKKITQWQECKLEDIKKEYPQIDDDLEEIYERVSDCKERALY